jgi:hypothetical protein
MFERASAKVCIQSGDVPTIIYGELSEFAYNVVGVYLKSTFHVFT